MKKIFYIFLSFFLFLSLSALIIYLTLPHSFAFLLGRAINGSARIEKLDIQYRDGFLLIRGQRVELKGNIKGVINSFYLSLNYKKRFFVKDVVVSHFHVTVEEKEKGKLPFIPVLIEHITLEKGTIYFNHREIFIHKLTLDHLEYNMPFYFFTHVENKELFQSVKASGTGTYGKKKFELNGKAEIDGLKGNLLYSNLGGNIHLSCNFKYENSSLALKGLFYVYDFSIREDFLSKPLKIKNTDGNFSFEYEKNSTKINISGIKFNATPFNIILKIDAKGLHSIDLNSGFLDVNDVKEYLSFKEISKDMEKYITYIKDGKVQAKRLIFRRNGDFLCDLEIKGATIIYNGIKIKNIGSNIIFDGSKIKIKDLYGEYKTSKFKNISGEINYKEHYTAHFKGDYLVNLIDIPSKFDIDNIKFKNGLTEGVFEFNFKGLNEYEISGRGKLKESEVIYKNVSVSANGFYRFSKDEIEFDPLVLIKDKTNIKIKGKWKKDFLKIKLLGLLDVYHIKPYINFPLDFNGLVEIDGELERCGDKISTSGFIGMEQLFYSIDRYFKKEKGIKNTLSIDISKKGGEFNIKRLDFFLEGFMMHLSGMIDNNKAKDIKLDIFLPEVNDIRDISFLNGEVIKGSILIDLYIKEILFPLQEIPYITGVVDIKNGYFKIPDMPSPLERIDVKGYFNGDDIELRAKNIKCGSSTINSLELYLKNKDIPEFTILADMGYFDFKDFETTEKIEIYSIEPDSIFARTSGVIDLMIKRFKLGNKVGEDLNLKTIYKDRKFTVSELKGAALNGDVDIIGTLDLSQTIPAITIKGNLNNISGGDFLKLFGAKTHIIESKEFISFDVAFKGKDMSEFTRTISGKATVYSEDGVIKRMNLLSKIFGLLNVYELLKGDVDLMTYGLRYKKTGGSFTIQNGIFTTNDYIIDSPAMVITGQGRLNIVDGTIDGKITVSPLVTIDRIISKIPILRNILKDKKRGFIYAIYDVKGPIEDPDINLGYIQTIGSLPLNILRGLLEYPKKLFKIR